MPRRTRLPTPQRPPARVDAAVRWRAADGRSVAALLVASGAVALVYETLWVRQLGRVVGVEVHAVSIALSAFFGGLALGGAIFGRLADRVARALRLYAILEAAVAIAGLIATLALARAAPLFVALQQSAGLLAWALPVLLVGVPAVFMGGTLPPLLRVLRPEGNSVAPFTARLYAANTIGAVAGTCATPFLLIPAFGLKGTSIAAAFLGALIAATAFTLDRRRDAEPVAAAARVGDAGGRSLDGRLALGLYALAGGVALGYEVVWAEMLVPFLSTRTYAFAVMLATYLGGIALGSALFARWRRAGIDPWRVFGLLLAGAAASTVMIVAVMGPWLPAAQAFAGKWGMRLSGSETIELLARFVVASVAVLMVPTTLLGAALPAAARLVASSGHRAGRDVGAVVALNTAGGIAGTLLTGFVLVPRLGLVRSLGTLAVAGAVLGAVAIAKGARGSRGATIGALALVATVAAFAFLTPGDLLARRLTAARGGTLLFYAEDTGGTVAVLEQPTAGAPFRRLYIQGVSNSGDSLPSLRYMRLQALLPLLLHPGTPRSTLVLGFGTGITAGAMLAYPTLERRVVAELLPSVVRAGSLFAGNLGAASDRRIQIRIGDGRHELLRSEDRYDVITLEPPPPSAAGVVNLYSRDFYALCRTRLAEGGLMAQWWPLPAQNDEDSRSLVRSFLDVFPEATLWTTELHEMLLVGSERPLVLDSMPIAARVAVPETRRALVEIGIESPEALLGTFVTNREGLDRYAAGAPPVTDDRPRIEHAAWVRRGEFQRVLPLVLDLASDPPLGVDDPMRAGMERERRELFAFYRAALHGYAGEGDAAAIALREVFASDPGNRYYRWVATGGRD